MKATTRPNVSCASARANARPACRVAAQGRVVSHISEMTMAATSDAAGPLDGTCGAERDPGRVAPGAPHGRRDEGIRRSSGPRAARDASAVHPSSIQGSGRGSPRRSKAEVDVRAAPDGRARRPGFEASSIPAQNVQGAPEEQVADHGDAGTASVPAIAEPTRHPKGSIPNALIPTRSSTPEGRVDERAHVPLLLTEACSFGESSCRPDRNRHVECRPPWRSSSRRTRASAAGQTPQPDHGAIARGREDRHPGMVHRCSMGDSARWPLAKLPIERSFGPPSASPILSR